jgi:hypothetical protein
MILEMKSHHQGNPIKEVEIATVSKGWNYVEKDQKQC